MTPFKYFKDKKELWDEIFAKNEWGEDALQMWLKEFYEPPIPIAIPLPKEPEQTWEDYQMGLHDAKNELPQRAVKKDKMEKKNEPPQERYRASYNKDHEAELKTPKPEQQDIPMEKDYWKQRCEASENVLTTYSEWKENEDDEPPMAYSRLYLAWQTALNVWMKLRDGTSTLKEGNERDILDYHGINYGNYTTAPQSPKEEEEAYRANFLWGFADDSIESLGYEFANGKTEEYLKAVWSDLIEKFKEKFSPKEEKE